MTYSNVVLIIVFNYSDCIKNIDFIKSIYEKYFKKIIFYSDFPIIKGNTEVNFININKGYNTHKIFHHFYENYKSLIEESDGLFYTMDDNIINVHKLEETDNKLILYNYLTSRIWDISNPNEFIKQKHEWFHFETTYGKVNVSKLLNDNEFKKYNMNKIYAIFSDYFYLPKRYLTNELFELFELFSIYEVFLEIAIPSIIYYIEKDKTQFQIFKQEILWKSDRKKFEDEKYVLNSLKNNLFIHPIKFNSNPKSMKWLSNLFINKKCIIITTINKPSEQLISYTKQKGWDLIVVGDSKTENELYDNINCIYLGLSKQKELFPTIYDKIPLKSYTRKMFGYLYAIKYKYEIIYDTDDDNKYLYSLDSYQNNFTILDNIDFPGYDIKKINIDSFDSIRINNESNNTIATGYTYHKKTGNLFLKDHNISKNCNATPHKECTSGFFRYNVICEDIGFVNLYKNYTDENIWPRGIPPGHKSINITPTIKNIKIDLQVSVVQGLVNNDPDVDAYYRINIKNTPFNFEKDPGYDIILNKYSVCPFNTQNTFWNDSSMFYAMYLPVSVTFRYTDILRGFIALYQLWKNNKTIKFTFPTAIQDRNEHDLNKDYESEEPMYNTVEKVIELLNENKNATIQEVYKILLQNNIVTIQELDTLNEWIALVNLYQK